MIYITLECTIILVMYRNYKIAASAMSIIAKRSSITTLSFSLIIETVGILSPKYICSIGGNKPLYEESSEEAIFAEQQILVYEKSTSFILKKYREILNSLNSEEFCNYFDNVNSKCHLKYRLLDCR